VIDLGSLSFGTYYLMETAAPAGYVQLSEPVLITVTDSGVTYNQDDNALSSSNQGVHFDTETQIYTLVVTNDAGFELPSTGGRGTMRFYILGVLFIGIAGVGVLLRRRFPILR
jgi:LPXTG-motif cell wall-anchored protein